MMIYVFYSYIKDKYEVKLIDPDLSNRLVAVWAYRSPLNAANKVRELETTGGHTLHSSAYEGNKAALPGLRDRVWAAQSRGGEVSDV